MFLSDCISDILSILLKHRCEENKCVLGIDAGVSASVATFMISIVLPSCLAIHFNHILNGIPAYGLHFQDIRLKEFIDIKNRVILCMDDLELVPETSFEKQVLCEDEAYFCLSINNLDSLKQHLSQV